MCLYVKLESAMQLLKRESRERLKTGIAFFKQSDYSRAYEYFEDAHILGQKYIREHTLSHWWMLRVSLRTNNKREFFGQILRMLASLIFSKIWVPEGNSGRASVSALQTMPIPEHLKGYYS